MSRLRKLTEQAKIEILKRVQGPPAGPFSASDVEWEQYVAKNQPGKPVFQAFVPIHRTEDFITGERLRGPSKFCKNDLKENAAGTLAQPQLYSFRRSQDYICEYGPEDYRKANRAVEVSSCKPKSGKGSKRSLREHGEGRKRGCQAKFTIQQLYLAPEVARIFYRSLEHEDKEGRPCHGRKDPTAKGTRHELAAGLSPFVRQWVDEQVVQEVPLAAILQKHSQAVADKHAQIAAQATAELAEPAARSRDDLLCYYDVHNRKAKIARVTSK